MYTLEARRSHSIENKPMNVIVGLLMEADIQANLTAALMSMNCTVESVCGDSAGGATDDMDCSQ